MYNTIATLADKTTHLTGWGCRINEYASQGKYMQPERSANHSAHSRAYHKPYASAKRTSA